MATIKVKNLDNVKKAVTKNLRVKINRVFSDKEARQQVGQAAKEDIQNRNFGPPSAPTKRWREIYDKLNKTDPKYSKNKLNMTFTGELMNDLANNVKGEPTKQRYVIKQSDKRHKKYKGKTKMVGSRPKYSEIQEGLENLGYKYLTLTEKGIDKITKIVRDKLFDFLGRN